MLEEGDYVLVIEEDRDTFLIGEVVELITNDNTPDYPYLVKFNGDNFWVRDVIALTPLIKALM